MGRGCKAFTHAIFRLRRYVGWAVGFAAILLGGCTGMWPRWFDTVLPPPDPPFIVFVAPMNVAAPIGDASDIYSFEEEPSEENEPQLRAQLIDEVAVHAQRVLTEELSNRPEFVVVPFLEARRLGPSMAPAGRGWREEELEELGRAAGADVVIAPRIDDYGRLGWRHWVYGWLTVASTHTAIVGAATAWNPLAMGAYLAYDLATDLPLWYGGAYILGWAFRPVHVQMEGWQHKPCLKRVWFDQEVVIIAPREVLAAYPEDQQSRKEVQLQVNLDQTLKTLATVAGETLRQQPCNPSKE